MVLKAWRTLFTNIVTYEKESHLSNCIQALQGYDKYLLIIIKYSQPLGIKFKKYFETFDFYKNRIINYYCPKHSIMLILDLNYFHRIAF